MSASSPPFFLFFFPFLLRLARPPRLLAMHRYPNKRASKNTPSFFLLLPAYYSVQPIRQFSLKFFLSHCIVTDCAPTTGRTRINCPCARTLELPLLVRSSVFFFFFCFVSGVDFWCVFRPASRGGKFRTMIPCTRTVCLSSFGTSTVPYWTSLANTPTYFFLASLCYLPIYPNPMTRETQTCNSHHTKP